MFLRFGRSITTSGCSVFFFKCIKCRNFTQINVTLCTDISERLKCHYCINEGHKNIYNEQKHIKDKRIINTYHHSDIFLLKDYEIDFFKTYIGSFYLNKY